MIPCFLILDPVLFAYHVRVPLSQNFQILKQLQHLYLGAYVLHWPVPDLHSLSATPAWGTQRQVLWWDVLMPEPWECGLKYYLVFVENLKIVSLMVVWLVRRLVHNRKPLISRYSRTALLELKNLTMERKYNSGEKMSEGTDSGILLSALTQVIPQRTGTLTVTEMYVKSLWKVDFIYRKRSKAQNMLDQYYLQSGMRQRRGCRLQHNYQTDDLAETLCGTFKSPMNTLSCRK